MAKYSTYEDTEYWLQKLIVCCLKIGISKKELFEDYYIDEIEHIFKQYNSFNQEDEVTYVGVDEFFNF